jgi:hypothetical protein
MIERFIGILPLCSPQVLTRTLAASDFFGNDFAGGTSIPSAPVDTASVVDSRRRGQGLANLGECPPWRNLDDAPPALALPIVNDAHHAETTSAKIMRKQARFTKFWLPSRSN